MINTVMMAASMSQSSLARLPPLQAIGKSQCVDLEDPPDLSDTEIDQFLDEYNGKERVYKYHPQHADAAANGLEEHFRVLTPGGHPCKRIAETATGFTHSRHSVAFSQKYSELRHLLQSRARLQFIRDYVSRINVSALFVGNLQNLVNEEYCMWQSICRGDLSNPPTTKLDHLSPICEDLRCHMNHWNSIKQALYTDPWLRCQLPQLVINVRQVQMRLYQLGNTAIWWVDRLVQIGFRVLAHCDLERFETEALWSITRGLEDFNTVISIIKSEKITSDPGDFSLEADNSYSYVGETIKPVAFGRVLNLLASERCRYAAATTHQFFTTCKDLLKIAVGKRGIGGGAGYHWGEELRGAPGVQTSDYHTDSGSRLSLGTAMLHVGDVIAPDLSHEANPLMDFARREKTFAQKFLQVVCHSTDLLRRPTTKPTSVTTQRRSPLLADTKLTNPPGAPPKPPPRSKKKMDKKDRLDPDGPVVSKKLTNGGKSPCRGRKSVSWSDAGEVSIIQQLILKYMELLWQYYGSSMSDQLVAPVWGGLGQVKGQLGSVILCSDLVTEVIVCMIQQTCAKDIFPAGALPVLATVSDQLRITTAWRTWDIGMCAAISSAAADKCHPVLLVDNEHSSLTAKCLRDAFQPLHSALNMLQLSLNTSQDASNAVGAVGLAISTMDRISSTCAISGNWCSTRGQLYLLNWTLGAFLLISQSDFKVIGDELRHAVANCKGVTRVEYVDKLSDAGPMTSTTRHKHHLETLLLEIESISAQHQALSGSLVKQFSEKCHSISVEYFEEEMPSGKIWKKRQSADGPLEPSQYIVEALDALLEPIIVGASKLASPSQLSVISMACTAMCEAWTQVILQGKIKFSISGALQLEADFNLVERWLEMYIQSAPVRQSVLSLDIFKYLHGIADILKRQPRATSRSGPQRTDGEVDSKGREGTTGSLCCDVSVDPEKSDQWRDGSSPAPPSSSSASDTDLDHQLNTANHSLEHNNSVTPPCQDSEDFKMPQMEQWLALRVHGGARTWPKLPSCFNNSHT